MCLCLDSAEYDQKIFTPSVIRSLLNYDRLFHGIAKSVTKRGGKNTPIRLSCTELPYIWRPKDVIMQEILGLLSTIVTMFLPQLGFVLSILYRWGGGGKPRQNTKWCRKQCGSAP